VARHVGGLAQPAKLGSQIGGALVSQLAVFLERAEDDAIEVG
jgi:hypothetical protein